MFTRRSVCPERPLKAPGYQYHDYARLQDRSLSSIRSRSTAKRNSPDEANPKGSLSTLIEIKAQTL